MVTDGREAIELCDFRIITSALDSSVWSLVPELRFHDSRLNTFLVLFAIAALLEMPTIATGKSILVNHLCGITAPASNHAGNQFRKIRILEKNMRLSSTATTPQELKEEIVALLLDRAKKHTALAKQTATARTRAEFVYGASVLVDLAGDIRNMELTETSPAALSRNPAYDGPMGVFADYGEENGPIPPTPPLHPSVVPALSEYQKNPVSTGGSDADL